MKSFNTALIAGACALGVTVAPASAESARGAKPAANSVGGISMKDIQEVGRGWGGGGRGFSGRSFGGGRGFAGRGWSGRSRGWGGRGWAGRGYGWRGRGYGYRRGWGYRRGYGWGPYVAGAAIAGVAVGAAASSPYYYDDDYYDDGYYAPRRSYRGSECQVISKRRDVDGRPVKVIRYRPC